MATDVERQADLNQTVALQPFSGMARPDDPQISARLNRAGAELQVGYSLRGALATLAIPAPAASPGRRDELWQTTCLELFLAVPDQDAYWEVNLSPSGDWNVYRLEGYRLNLEPEPALATLPFSVRRQPDGLDLELALPLAALPGAEAVPELEAALTAVVETADSEISYWAIVHPGPRPDFHRRDGFVLRV